MGYSVDRFVTCLDEWYRVICPICHDVIEKPLEAKCKHAFCRECILKYLRDRQGSGRCPDDGSWLKIDELVPLSKTLKYLMDKQLMIHCNFYSEGCEEIVPLEHLEKHVSRCPFKRSRIPRFFGSNTGS